MHQDFSSSNNIYVEESLGRSKSVIKNTIWEMGYYIAVIALGFLAPRYIILYYSSEVNGLTSTVQHIINIILMLQAGATTAAIYSLYKPIAENKYEEIVKNLASAEAFFKRIAYIFGGLMFCVAVVTPFVLRTNLENYQTADTEFLSNIIKICLELKSAVVNQDEKEAGLRKILNLGHTFGHALEEETKYKRFSHGHAVVLGMMFIFNYALQHELCSKQYYDEAFTLLNIYGYEPDRLFFICKKNLIKYMKTDKKSSSGSITFIIPTEYGRVIEHKEENLTSSAITLKYQP